MYRPRGRGHPGMCVATRRNSSAVTFHLARFWDTENCCTKTDEREENNQTNATRKKHKKSAQIARQAGLHDQAIALSRSGAFTQGERNGGGDWFWRCWSLRIANEWMSLDGGLHKQARDEQSLGHVRPLNYLAIAEICLCVCVLERRNERIASLLDWPAQFGWLGRLLDVADPFFSIKSSVCVRWLCRNNKTIKNFWLLNNDFIEERTPCWIFCRG